MLSVQAMTAAQAVLGGWLALPEDLKERIPLSWAIGTAIALLVFGTIGRLIDQPKVQQ